jgi:hypothetical protein
MVENGFVVEQAHEIQALAKELELFPCLLPDKFAAGGIIDKLSPSWRDFVTSLKHKREEFSMVELIGSLDVQERTRAKDNCGKGVESSAANMVQVRVEPPMPSAGTLLWVYSQLIFCFLHNMCSFYYDWYIMVTCSSSC